ncbi:hypothetical protein BaRGS_00028725 [Batillaria attramentaria]|uniref:Uncharacterized protein n=1 Tax=Batillaria attramentaria TaxID=370345 RepID=A0ABD0JY44_9CAEN
MAVALVPPSQQRQRNLTCGVCQEIYRAPRLLPCHHSFCLICIEGLVNVHGQSFPCPVCRKPTRVPVGGARVFPNNFWVTEEDLQLARNSVDAAMCPNHSMELLIFLCTECDQAICLRCRLTKHNNHNCEDLSEVAHRCKAELTEGQNRLEVTIRRLNEHLGQAKDNLRAAQHKRVSLKEQVQAQSNLLMARIARWREAVLKDVDTTSDALEEQLKQEVQNVQHELNSILPLQQRVQNALSEACDTDIVDAEKELRVGAGREEELVKAEDGMSTRTQRQGLYCDVSSVTDEDIKKFLGSLVTLDMPNVAVMETITQIYQFKREGLCNEVHAICPLDNGDVCVALGGIPPDYKGEMCGYLQEEDGMVHLSALDKRVTFKRFNGDESFHSTYHPCAGQFYLASKSASMLVLRWIDETCGVLETEVTSSDPFETQHTHLFEMNVKNKPLAFDASSTEMLFVVLEDAQKETCENMSDDENTQLDSTSQNAILGEEKTKVATALEKMEVSSTDTDSGCFSVPKSSSKKTPARTVQLYCQDHSEPIAKYIPPETPLPFLPTDVCFWHTEDEEKLLVTDWMNDSVHVVKVDDTGTCCFERHLAAGNGHLVKPSALDRDSQGRLWIGCSNGWLLRCEESKDIDDMTDIDGSDADSLVIVVD